MTIDCALLVIMDELVAAIRELRSGLGDSQQAFANRLGLSLRAIGNYEAGRTPTASVLFALVRLAQEHKQRDLAKIFSAAYSGEMKGRVQPSTPDETAWVRSMLAVIRNKELVPNWKDIATALITGLEVLVKTAKIDAAVVKTDILELEETLIEARYQLAPTAERQLSELAKQRSAQTGESFEQAYVKVLMDNPALYSQYQQERADAADGTQFAPSFAVYGTRQHGEAQQKEPQQPAPQKA